MKVEDIEEAILKLSPAELTKFRRWFAEFESGMAPPEAPAARIGRLAGRAVAEIRKRVREPE
jgi:hypothetical protein